MKIEYIKVDDISPNFNQPRKIFEKKSLEELKESIKTKGVIQPIIIRKENDKYLIIAGERRWRASKELGLTTIPSIIKKVNSAEEIEISIIENIQRENLSPIEEAFIYKKYLQKTGTTQVELGKTLGKSRSYISNIMRLLKLPKFIVDFINTGELSYGHGKALLAIDDEKILRDLSNRIIKERLSVREVEIIVRDISKKTQKKDIFIRDIEYKIENNLGNKVNITEYNSGGKIVINYQNTEDLEEIVQKLLR